MTETFDALTVPLTPGTTLVEASAGTGKTYAITELVLRLVLEPGALGEGAPDLRKLLVVTFTVAATEELKTRIRRALREAVDAFEASGEGVRGTRYGARLDAAPEATGAGASTPLPTRSPLPLGEGQGEGRTEHGAVSEDAPRTRYPVPNTPEASGDAPSPFAAPFLARFGATPEARRAGAARLRHVLGQVGEASVFTIHGFCKRVLERSAFESGEPFAFEFTEDAARLRTRVARDVWHRLVGGHPDLGPLALAAGWTLERLDEHAKAATRYDRTAILPPARPLAEATGAVREARQRLREAWDPAAQETVVDPGLWRRDKKSRPFTDDLAGVFARVEAFAGGDWARLPALRMATVEKVSAAIKDGSKAGKAAVEAVARDAGFGACTAVAEAVDALEIALVHAFVAELEAGAHRAKAAAGLLTFDDLIRRLDRALAHPSTGPALRRAVQDQFAVALIDEFQDTDPVQYRIFRRAFGAAGGSGAGEGGMGDAGGEDEGAPEASGNASQPPAPNPQPPPEGRPLFFIGDPKQAIYAFRGADVFAYLRARQDADRHYTLGTNYRSSPDLVAAVNALFSRLGPGARPFVYRGIPFRGVGANATEGGLRGVHPPQPFVWWAADGLENTYGIVNKGNAREAVTDAVVTEICALLNAPQAEVRDRHTGLWRRLEAGDLAVLVRKNDQARELQDRLRRAGVTAVVGKGADIRESREMDEVERVLRAMARPSDARRVRAALATEMWGWTAAHLAEGSGSGASGDGASAADARMLRVVEGLRRDRAAWRRRGVFGALTRWVRREGVRQRLRAYADGERRLTNLRHVMELLHEAEAAEGRSVDELLHWVRTRSERTFAEKERVEMRLESDDHAVQLVTMHNAKGLEYPVVFAPFLWDDKDKETWPGSAFVPKPPLAHVGGGMGDTGGRDAGSPEASGGGVRDTVRGTGYEVQPDAAEELPTRSPLPSGEGQGEGHAAHGAAFEHVPTPPLGEVPAERAEGVPPLAPSEPHESAPPPEASGATDAPDGPPPLSPPDQARPDAGGEGDFTGDTASASGALPSPAPSPRPLHYGAVYDLGSPLQDDHRALADAERMAESLRLAYVAMTRARERLYVAWGPLRGGEVSGLGHLLRDLPLALDAHGLARLDDDARKTAKAHLKTSLDRLEEWIEHARLDGVMAVAPLPFGGGAVERQRPYAESSGVRALAPEAQARARAAEARASFSAWASGVPHSAGHDAGDRADDDGAAGDDAPEAETGMAAFASGARAGTCLHEVLEGAVWRLPASYRDPAHANAQAVARVLRRHGLHDGRSRVHRAPLAPEATVCALIADLAETPLPDLGFALKDVERGGFAPEWRFVAPLAEVAPSQIADVFRAHGDESLRDYAEVVARLSPEATRGLFVGSADLVVRHPEEERWSLIDWKSNHLGPSPAHYGPEALARAMRARHYLLQAHLYAAGLHRHLRTRMPGYSYERHVGHVAYVFLRGITGEAPEASGEGTSGVLALRPSSALVEALDALLFEPPATDPAHA